MALHPELGLCWGMPSPRCSSGAALSPGFLHGPGWCVPLSQAPAATTCNSQPFPTRAAAPQLPPLAEEPNQSNYPIQTD